MSEVDHRLGMKLKFVYSVFGLLLGFSCIVAGIILSMAGVVGHTSWAASLVGFTTNLNDAAPGVVVFIIGVFFVFITRFTVTVKETPRGPGEARGKFVRYRK
jgi:phosphotransferase system  glucose/maltose/N-acetylglucosamine-specific IIC component